MVLAAEAEVADKAVHALVGETPLPPPLLPLPLPRAAAATAAISTRLPATPSSRKRANLWLGGAFGGQS